MAHAQAYDPRQLIAKAHHARNQGRDRQAIALYRRILIEEPRNVDVALRAAPLLAYRGASFEAWQLFCTALAELLRGRRFEAGLGVLREACRCVPREYEAWRQRARLELKLGREDVAYQTLLEGRQQFRAPQTRAQAIALLTRARAIEPWDAEVCIDLARLYIETDQVEVASELLASLAERVRGRELRRVRALQWRITLSPRHAWLWLRALVSAERSAAPSAERSAAASAERGAAASAAPKRVQASPPAPVTSLFGELRDSAVPAKCIALERKASA